MLRGRCTTGISSGGSGASRTGMRYSGGRAPQRNRRSSGKAGSRARRVFAAQAAPAGRSVPRHGRVDGGPCVGAADDVVDLGEAALAEVLGRLRAAVAVVAEE